MKTILLLAACVCGAISVLYAAATDGGTGGLARPDTSQTLATGLGRMGAAKVTLAALSHQFAPVNATQTECDQN